jgi:hypothetical protein
MNRPNRAVQLTVGWHYEKLKDKIMNGARKAKLGPASGS